VMMKRTHELGDGADDCAELYMSRCKYNITSTVLFVVDCKVLAIMQNLESIVDHALCCSFVLLLRLWAHSTANLFCSVPQLLGSGAWCCAIEFYVHPQVTVVVTCPYKAMSSTPASCCYPHRMQARLNTDVT